MKNRCRVWIVAGALLVFGYPALASDIPMGEFPEPANRPSPDPNGLSTPFTPDTYGTVDWIQLNLGAVGFVPLDDGTWSSTFDGKVYRNGGSNSAACHNVVLPTGALVNGITVYLYDNSATGWMQVQFFELNWMADTATNLFEYATVAAETPGWVKDFDPLTAGDHTINNGRRGYRVCAFQWTDASADLGHYGISIWYHLQISPAPAVATFPDVAPGYWAFQAIESLADSGITTGFPDGTFKPTNPVTRAQMATFLARALGLHWSDF